MNQSDFNYRSFPALATYIDRIGAEQLNFRKFIVKETQGKYYSEKALIRLKPDGSIVCSNKEYAPSEAEQSLIKEFFSNPKNQDFPKELLATEALFQDLAQRLGEQKGKNIYKLITRYPDGDGYIKMVRQRVDFKDGGKAYLPWTYFQDLGWMQMEPEGLLPFWKPTQKRSEKIMVHEGEKAAREVTRMLLEDTAEAKEWRATHPWFKELDQYDHWGIIGGALAPHRADYSELRREKPTEVVYAADNDEPGRKVCSKFSEYYKSTMLSLTYDASWPPSFDLADPMPTGEKFRAPNGKWIGGSMEDKLNFATWATELVPNEDDSKKKNYRITDNFEREWLQSIEPEVFIHLNRPSKQYTYHKFNNKVRPYSHIADTAALFQKLETTKAEGLKYDPTMLPGLFHQKGGGIYINSYVAPRIEMEAGDCTPWEDYIKNLLPVEEDRNEVLRWLATLIHHPANRMHYGVLLISEQQGVGKSTLGEKILQPLLGENNVSFPSEKQIVDSQFNGWITEKRLAVIHEIYSGSTSKAYNNLKSALTDEDVTVNVKFKEEFKIKNWLHILACSNHPRALKIDSEDRRWLIPKVSEAKRPNEFWFLFNDWLRFDNGTGKIAYWLKEFLKDHRPVAIGEHAPWTSVKQQVIQEGLSDGQKLVQIALANMIEAHPGEDLLVLDTDLVKLIRDHQYDGKPNSKLEKPSTARRAVKDDPRWFVSAHSLQFREWGAYNSRFLCTNPEHREMKATELLAAGLRPRNPREYAPV